MKKTDIKEFPEYFDYFINLNKDVELLEAFENSLKQIDAIDILQFKRIALKTYEEGKWSINKIFQHLSDWERIWCYRTIVAACREGTVLMDLNKQLWRTIQMQMNYQLNN